MYYVYILQSIKIPERHYTGFTEDIEKRVLKHNNGEVPHSAGYKPWEILTLLLLSLKPKQ